MPTKDNNEVVITTNATKPKKKRFSFDESKAINPDPGDNSTYLAVCLELLNLPKISLKDPEQVKSRLNEFFEIHRAADIKPTVSGLAMTLAMDRRRLWEIKTGAKMGSHASWDLPQETVDAIKKAYQILDILWEEYMQSGKINPVAGIFLGKNNHGMQDKVEHVVTAGTNDAPSAEQIAANYADYTDEE
jgi:hypothetical protein